MYPLHSFVFCLKIVRGGNILEWDKCHLVLRTEIQELYRALEGLLKHRLPGLLPGISDSTGLGQRPETVLSKEFPGHTDAAMSRATLWEWVPQKQGSAKCGPQPKSGRPSVFLSFHFFFFFKQSFVGIQSHSFIYVLSMVATTESWGVTANPV